MAAAAPAPTQWLSLDDFQEVPPDAFDAPLTKFRDLPVNTVLRVTEHYKTATKFGVAHFATLEQLDGQEYVVVLPSTWERSLKRFGVVMDDPVRSVFLRYSGVKDLANGHTIHEYARAQPNAIVA